MNLFQPRKLFPALVIIGASLGFLGGCAKAPARVVAVEMKKYAVIPAEIRLRQGEDVVLEVRTADVQHGFDVPELGISESVQPGQIARVKVPTKRTGSFEVKCGIVCGARHDEMNGRLIIE
jgi:cytochrome c oxidase subunit II